MKNRFSVAIVPNRDRGYDAIVSVIVSRVRNSTFMRNLTGRTHSEECETVARLNAPSESAARDLAEKWIAEQPKPARKARVLTDAQVESYCSTREAARNERDYQ